MTRGSQAPEPGRGEPAPIAPGWVVLRRYRRGWLRGDVVAGLVLVTVLVPQGMAYAELAGLPAINGLYATVVGLVAYAVLGPSRRLVVGPDSALAPMILAALVAAVIVDGDPQQAVATASVLALMVGGICLLAGLLRLGAVAELLSRPVRIGYMNGLALVMIASQLPRLFGFPSGGARFFPDLGAFLRDLRDGAADLATLSVGAGCLAVILVLRRWWPAGPGVLVAILAAMAASALFGLSERIEVVGDVPAGLPAPVLPSTEVEHLGVLLASAAGIAFVALADGTALSRVFASSRGEQVDPNREVVALGAANVATGVFQGFPISASSSRTAVAAASGARTQLTGLIGAAGVVVILVAVTDVLAHLPSAALAAIVIAAGIAIFDLRTLVWLARVRRSEFLLSSVALAGVLVLGVLPGLGLAVAMSLAVFVRRAWRPYDALLGRVEGRKGYHDVERNPHARRIPGLVLYRFDAPLFFANADHFRRRLLRFLDASDEPVRWVAIVAEPVTDIDTTGAEALSSLLDELDDRGVRFVFAGLKGPQKDRLRDYGLYDRIGDEHFYPTVGTAVRGYLDETGVEWRDWTEVEGDWTPP